MRLKNLQKTEIWILAGIPVLFAIGSAMHFLYEFSGKNLLIGIFAPVNESVWEHSKLVLLPVILWWWLYYAFRKDKQPIDKKKWFAGALASLTVSLLAMPLLYYFYTGAFGKEILWVDILILLLALTLGQLCGLHFCRYAKGISPSAAGIAFACILFLFALFTFCPPHIPWFRDAVSGGYGILP